ncbi:hypothetical protein AMJ57_00285 [Parcubacteria bacterium SG8_24]|nr:MAG: hypothetical protein AMJ57_00285 [Parcubacteria bacterium SG8_24]
MEKERFYREVNERILDGLSQTDIPMERMKELARRALDVSSGPDPDVPEERLQELRSSYPDVFESDRGVPDAERRTPKSGRR